MKRDTRQKETIKKTLFNAQRPLAINEIFELARQEIEGLGIATVYRNLKILQEDGVITPVNVSGQPTHWELSTKCHHHHYLCVNCNKLYEIPSCLEGLKRMLPEGFDLEDHEILLKGRCANCSKNIKLSS